MATKAQPSNARDRILATAADLFYRNGYRATGINEVIEKASVAKATFYAHFPTKDALCLAYLKERNSEEAQEILAFVAKQKTPLDKLYGVMDSIEGWAKRTEYRGCQFINIVPEVPDQNSAIRVQGHLHYDWARELVFKLTTELIDSDKKKYGQLDAKEITEAYMTHLAGAIALAGVYNEVWPIKSGIKAVRRLVKK
jgi:AcrR family transcriptional regulator